MVVPGWRGCGSFEKDLEWFSLPRRAGRTVADRATARRKQTTDEGGLFPGGSSTILLLISLFVPTMSLATGRCWGYNREQSIVPPKEPTVSHEDNWSGNYSSNGTYFSHRKWKELWEHTGQEPIPAWDDHGRLPGGSSTEAKGWRMTGVSLKMKGGSHAQGRGNSLCKCRRGSKHLCSLRATNSLVHCT